MEEIDILGQIPQGALLRDVVAICGESPELMMHVRGSEHPFLLVSSLSGGTNGCEGFNTTRFARSELKFDGEVRLSKKLEWMVFVVCKRANSNAFLDMITFGRAQNNDIVMESSVVSKFHAYFIRREGGWEIQDHGSKNGTTVQGVKLEKKRSYKLTGGESLRLGSHRAEFLSAENMADMIEMLQQVA